MKIGFIGAGNMGSAMIAAVARSKFADLGEIFVYDRSKNENLKFKFGITPLSSEREVVQNSDIIVLAIKPNGYENLLNLIKKDIKEQIILTLAPNFSIEKTASIIGDNKKIVRTMPNTPAAIGEGVTAVSFGENLSAQEKDNVMSLLACFGSAHEIDEALMGAFVGIAGSLPAYVFMFIEALADAGVLNGVPRAKAYEIVAASVAGSADMVLKSGKHPAMLKDEVCSPSGTTIEALRVLEERGFRSAVIEAVNAAVDKANGKI